MASSPTKIKIPQIVRWRVAGVSEVKIADLLGVTTQSIRQIVCTQEYMDEETAVLNAQITKMDEALAGKVDVIHQNFRVAVPAAMRALVDAVTQRKDLKTAIAAAGEILDRDPDRTLARQTARKEGEREAPKLPDEVLAQAVVENNEIANALNGRKGRVN
jgi:dsDNA-specific endonuclease/ATPase MutS2